MVTDNTLDLLKKRYFRKNEKTWEDLCERVSTGISKAEEIKDRDKFKKIFYDMMVKFEFIPSTPCLINADENNNGQLSSCFIIDIRDNIESIYQAKSECAKIFQKNGGVGFNISALRPKGTTVETSKGYSCGTIGFMEEFNLTADVVTRNNIRKGAIKIDLNDWHPDILEFIHCKDDKSKFTHMNLSTSLSNKFMNAVKNNDDWYLVFPDYSFNKNIYNKEWDGNLEKWVSKGYPIKTYQKLKARQLYTEIMESAWISGDPGVSFRDIMNIFNPNPHLGIVNSTNPCAEFCSIPYNSCNLGSINLTTCVEEGKFNYDKFKTIIQYSIRFIDNMITVNKLPFEKISQITKSTRSVGLGIMGLADCLYILKIPYNKISGYEFIEKIFSFMKNIATNTSIELAKEKGVYPAWEGSIWEQSNIKIRNSNLLSIAPTGSISFIANTSGGLEPNFALTYSRRTNEGDLYYITNSIFEKELKSKGLYSKQILQKVINNKGSCVGIEEIPKDMQEIFVIASDITPTQHTEVVGIIQKYVDLSTSKTVNLPKSATVEDIKNIYMYAWELGCKGITVYRDGCIENQTLSVNREEIKKEDYIIPKQAMARAKGERVKLPTGCGSIWLMTFKDKYNNLAEIFSQPGTSGGCTGLTEALTRTVSLLFRSGVHPDYIIDQLQSVKCPVAMNARKEGKCDGKSCSDIIAKELLYQLGKTKNELTKNENNSRSECNNENFDNEDYRKCPDCGEKLRSEGGCVVCVCGFSLCS